MKYFILEDFSQSLENSSFFFVGNTRDAGDNQSVLNCSSVFKFPSKLHEDFYDSHFHCLNS